MEATRARAGRGCRPRSRSSTCVDRLQRAVPDHGGDLGALLGRELGAGAGLTDGGLRPRLRFMLPLGSVSAFMPPLRSSRPSAFMLPLRLAALGLHLLAALGVVVLRAHALRLLALACPAGARSWPRPASSARTARPSCRTRPAWISAGVDGSSPPASSRNSARSAAWWNPPPILRGSSGSLRIGETGSGDQRSGSHRHHEAIGH